MAFDAFFVLLFLHLVWADNADIVSCAYSGTGALKTDFTRYFLFAASNIPGEKNVLQRKNN